MSWSNWAGNVGCEPRLRVDAANEAEVVAALREAEREGLGVRVAGSGHSFSPLVATDGLLLSLVGLTGIARHEPEQRRVWVRAGTKLHALGPELHALGLAYAQLKQPEKARATLDRAIQSAPDNPQIKESRALIDQMAAKK